MRERAETGRSEGCRQVKVCLEMADAGADAAEYELALRTLEEGIPVRRVKAGRLGQPALLALDGSQLLKYPASRTLLHRLRLKCVPAEKLVDVANVQEVRQGYRTDGLHLASKHFRFQEKAPVSEQVLRPSLTSNKGRS